VSDIFSLGVVIYEMVAGRVPFEGETASDVIAAILKTAPPPLSKFAPEAPSEVQRIVSKSLRKDAGERYQTARDMLVDLKSLKQGMDFEARQERSSQPHMSDEVNDRARQTEAGATAPTTSSAGHPVGEIRRHKRAALAFLAMTAMLIVVIVYALKRNAGNSLPASPKVGSATAAEIGTLAVLPFVNMGADPVMQYLGDGVTESLINSLSQLSNLKVMSRNSVFRYKAGDRQAGPDAQAVGRELGVRAVLTGRIVQRGDNLSISVELVDVNDNSHIRGEQYDRKLSDLLAVQRELAKEITRKLRVKLTGEDEKRLTKGYTENTEAYQLYLKGRYYWNKRTEEGIKRSIEYFKDAISEDPRYALAYAGLSDGYHTLAGIGLYPPGEVYPRRTNGMPSS
jgi:eukaryotic-like serine/threonine-protein kinase